MPGGGHIHNMTCYCSVLRRIQTEKMTFITKIFPPNIPLTFLYNSHLQQDSELKLILVIVFRDVTTHFLECANKTLW